jgi:hypothetical protein
MDTAECHLCQRDDFSDKEKDEASLVRECAPGSWNAFILQFA